MKILEGKTLAAKIKETLPQRVERVTAALGRAPRLVGLGWPGDYAGLLYLTKEVNAARKLNIRADIVELNEQTKPEDFIKLLAAIAGDETIDALLIPRPLPPALNSLDIAPLLMPAQDIDGAGTISLGRLFACKTWQDIKNLNTFIPCCPLAVMELMEYHNIDLQGKKVAVIGRSNTVGKPLAQMLLCRNATVSICHTKTTDLGAILREQDIVISAAGRARFVTADMLRPSCIVIDVGTNQDEDGIFCGDVDFDNVKDFSDISPVPGGVGPVTLANLLQNIVISSERKIK